MGLTVNKYIVSFGENMISIRREETNVSSDTIGLRRTYKEGANEEYIVHARDVFEAIMLLDIIEKSSDKLWRIIKNIDETYKDYDPVEIVIQDGEVTSLKIEVDDEEE